MLALVRVVLGRTDQPSLLLAQRRPAVAFASVSIVIAEELAQTIAQRALFPDWLFVASAAGVLAPLPVLVPAARTSGSRLADGLSRGAIEALAIAGCFVPLSRRLGLRTDTPVSD
jgi:hypothetical protein